jgi:hypothetical protein
MRVKTINIIFALFITSVFFCGYAGKAAAQDFDVSVIINTDVLSTEAKEKLKDFKQQVEDYFNKNKFADGPVYKVKATLQFNFVSHNGLDYWNTQIYILSQRIIDKADKVTNPKYSPTFKYLDERCNFNYNRSTPFIVNVMRFDTFLSLLDYYAYLMLGFDADSFFPVSYIPQKSGTAYFQKCLDICNKPMSDRNGWSETGGGSKPSRLQLVQEITNPKYISFRMAFYDYHWNGIDSLGLSENSYKYILSALERISAIKKTEPKSYNVDLFYEVKNQEIADAFLNYNNKTIYDKLITLDPSHQRIYEEAKKKAK